MMECYPLINKTISKIGQESTLNIVMVLDIKEPEKVLYHTKAPIFTSGVIMQLLVNSIH